VFLKTCSGLVRSAGNIYYPPTGFLYIIDKSPQSSIRPK